MQEFCFNFFFCLGEDPSANYVSFQVCLGCLECISKMLPNKHKRKEKVLTRKVKVLRKTRERSIGSIYNEQ